uniref:Uncharacterized protein n=1 Tax=Globisporangium ultimum (strain ATCC 200006 / CBS 805.95 / DAOM BR144) TaxID=431595 RepID=K3W620_GLOUD
MAYDAQYVFPGALSDAQKSEIQRLTQQQLTEMLGVEVDTVMAVLFVPAPRQMSGPSLQAHLSDKKTEKGHCDETRVSIQSSKILQAGEYVLVMVGNKKNMAQISHDLIDFIGEESAEQFVEWLSGVLPTYETKGTEIQEQQALSAPAAQQEATATAPSTNSNEAPSTKRVISLKGISSSNQPTEKKMASLSSSRGTVRTLNRSTNDADDVLAKRSQRFGVVEKNSPKRGKPAQKQTREEPRPAATKRKAIAEPESSSSQRRGSGGRLSQLLGPPVNVDQAELDARDSLNSHKKKKTNPRPSSDSDREKPARSNNTGRTDRNDQENQDSDSNRKPRRKDERDQRRPGDAAPPLPPNDQPERPSGYGRNGGRGGPPPNGQHGGYFNGPPGYGGFPPPYGHPMYFQPPPFGQMHPYGMGFPPHHGGPGPYGGQGPYNAPPVPAMPGAPHHAARGPRPAFQNKKWVNPNVAKAAEETSADAGASSASGEGTGASGSATLNPGASTFVPRNPYYPSQMRPRFQNKTWVRPDPVKDEEFSLSLPTTPPPEGVENTQ